MDKNVLMLSAISGNDEAFHKAYDTLKRYGNSIASESFSDPVLREQVVSQAMDKFSDKLHSITSNKPWNYAKAIISNSIIDIARQRGRSFHLEGSFIDLKEMAQIDERFAKIPEEEKDNCDDFTNSGWHVFKVEEPTDGKHRKNLVETTQELMPPSLNYLETILASPWWCGLEEWSKSGTDGKPCTVENCMSFRYFNELIKQANSKRWNRYNLISALIDNITSSSEKRVILHFLWNFKQVEIANMLRVSKPYVSTVIKEIGHKWGWTDEDVAQAQILLLTKQLADWYGKTKVINHPPSQRLRDLYAQLNKARDEWDYWLEKDDMIFNKWLAEIRKNGLNNTLTTSGRAKESVEQNEDGEIISKALAAERAYYGIEELVDEEKQKQEKELHSKYGNDILPRNQFFTKVISLPQTKAHFPGISLTEEKQLNKLYLLAASCNSSWYPNIRLRELPPGRLTFYQPVSSI